MGINPEYEEVIEAVEEFLEKGHEVKGLCTKALSEGYWSIEKECKAVIPG